MLTVPRTYREVATEVDSIADNLGMPIDTVIKNIVTALRVWHLPTDGSCEGHEEHGNAYPWVEIYAPEQLEPEWKAANKAAREHLRTLLESYYSDTDTSYRFEFENIGIFGGFRLVPQHYQTMTTYSVESVRYAREAFDSLADYLIKKAAATLPQ